MSRRPRLVEEGEPIVFAKDTQEHHTQSSIVHRHISPQAKVASSSFGGSSGGGSSLQKAAGTTSFPKRRLRRGTNASKTQTSFVIGGGGDLETSPSLSLPFSNSNAASPHSHVTGSSNDTGDAVFLHSISAAESGHHPQHWGHHGNFHTTETSMTIGGEHPHDIVQAPHYQQAPQHYHQHQHHHHHVAHHYPVDSSNSHLYPNLVDQHHAQTRGNHGDILDDHDMEEDESHRMEDDHAPPHPTRHFTYPHHPHPPYISPATTTSPLPVHKTPSHTTPSKTPKIQTSYEIGGTNESSTTVAAAAPPIDHRPIERMEGVEDLGMKMPLVVLDGANVAHHYAQAMAGLDQPSLAVATTGKPEPDAQGIKVATDHFLQAGLRVLVVLPQYWFKAKPRSGDNSVQSNALMETPQLEILNDLKTKGLIVASPPTDDDDAYALTIARREEMRSLSKRNGEGPGFVLSNDLFRDAQNRDSTGSLRQWLKHGRHDTVGPGRISYTFGDMGTMNDRGERILDFIPNPRHPLVIWMEGQLLSQHL
jgi:Zc3h12a-like Ribonuclease NYN domain